ncbi:hypothetical protein Daesc_000448 [Daldinia eschscholtzii]|uniref:AB hydrolase-1 domain-containing protein n=1 Tax=Daldinia eschscholtzii TaxID=292717 RepID=A0AAX6MZP0_9PEZI
MAPVTLSTLLLTSLAAVASARNCKNLTIPLSLSVQNADFTLKAPSNDIEVTNYVLHSGRAGVYYADEILSEEKAALFKFSLDGAAFDRTYWDFPAHAYNYSYANAALARNYSVFFFDRPGIGQSSRGDPVNEIQSNLEVAALYALTTKLRRGAVPGVDSRHDKIVHVGHSYGSAQTYALAAAAHSDEPVSDALALTGFTLGLGTYVNNFLFGANFVLADREAYGPGYITAGDVSAVQSNFFAPDNFDPEILEEAYKTGAPTAVGELLTIGALTATNNSYSGPVFVITGENDIAFCGGNCYVTNPSIPAQVASSFPNNTLIESYVVAGSGHGLNLEYSAQDTYARILDFFDKSV